MKPIKRILKYLHIQALKASRKNFENVYNKFRIRTTEQKLAQTKKNLMLLTDNIQEYIFIKDDEGIYQFVNENFAKLFNLTPKQITGKTLEDIANSNNEVKKLPNINRDSNLNASEVMTSEWSFTDCNGNQRIFRLSKLPYIMPDKRIVATLGIAEDITLEKIHDAERTKMMTDIMERNKNLEQFSYIVSHTLRAPVANMIGIMNELEAGIQTKALEKILLSELCCAVKRVDAIIAELNEKLHTPQVKQRRKKPNTALNKKKPN